MPLTPLDYTDCNQQKCSNSNGSVIFDCASPCTDGGEFDYVTGLCDRTGVYEYRSELKTLELLNVGPAVRYYYIEVAPPFFNAEGNLMTESVSAGSIATTTDGGVFCTDNCDGSPTEDFPCAIDLPAPYICTNSTSQLDCFGCGAPDSFQCSKTYSEWYVPPTIQKSLCVSQCEDDPDYNTPTEFQMYSTVTRVTRDEGYVRQTQYVEPSLSRTRTNPLLCSSGPRAIVFEDSLTYIGSATLEEYFPGVPQGSDRVISSPGVQLTPADPSDPS